MPKFPENFFVERIHCGHPDRGRLERRRQGRVHLDTLVHDALAASPTAKMPTPPSTFITAGKRTWP